MSKDQIINFIDNLENKDYLTTNIYDKKYTKEERINYFKEYIRLFDILTKELIPKKDFIVNKRSGLVGYSKLFEDRLINVKFEDIKAITIHSLYTTYIANLPEEHFNVYGFKEFYSKLLELRQYYKQKMFLDFKYQKDYNILKQFINMIPVRLVNHYSPIRFRDSSIIKELNYELFLNIANLNNVVCIDVDMIYYYGEDSKILEYLNDFRYSLKYDKESYPNMSDLYMYKQIKNLTN